MFLSLCRVQITLLKKGMRQQAEGMHMLSGHCQRLYAAQIQLVDLLPDAPPPVSDDKASTEKDKQGMQTNNDEETNSRHTTCIMLAMRLLIWRKYASCQKHSRHLVPNRLIKTFKSDSFAFEECP